ncbi:MAG: glycosyltransferase family 4 protein [Pseudomonadota bacterium]
MSGKIAFAVPGKITNLTGGTIYDRRVMQELTNQGFDVHHIELPDSFPAPTDKNMDNAFAKLAQVSPGAPLIVDGLAFGALDTDRLTQLPAACIALVHHPLAEEHGLAENRRAFLHQNETNNLAFARHVLVTSLHTAELLSTHYGVERQKISVAVPGVERPKLAQAATKPPLILAVGIQLPRKGHDILLNALSQIRDLEWNAIIVGAALDECFAAELKELQAQLGLSERVKLVGRLESDQVDRLYSQASIFALATRYEGYGIVFNEALVRGLPIVSCATGAVVDTVPEGAGLLIQPEAPDAFADALRTMLTDHALRAACAAKAKSAGDLLPSWSDTAANIAVTLNTALEYETG